MNKHKVYIVNKSTHNFSAATEYGDIVFLSEGPMNRYSVNNMCRQFLSIMEDSEGSDYIVPCSLNVMNSVASAIFAYKHGRLNLLLFKNGSYLERNVVFDAGADVCEFYPTDGSAVCACGSDISGKFICTKDYGEVCQWANERRDKCSE